MVGVLGAVVLAAQASDYKAGLVVLTIGVVASGLAGLVSALQAAKDVLVADTPLKKGFATFLQFLAAGLATITVASVADIASFPHVALPLVVAALIAGVQSYFQNSAEAVPA